MKENNVLQKLNIKEKDYNKFINFIKDSESKNYDIETMVEKLNDLKIEGKKRCFSFYVSTILFQNTQKIVEDFVDKRAESSDTTIINQNDLKNGISFLGAFEQVCFDYEDNRNPTLELLSIFVPIAVLISNPLIPMHIIIKLLNDLMQERDFSYLEVLNALSRYLEINALDEESILRETLSDTLIN